MDRNPLTACQVTGTLVIIVVLGYIFYDLWTRQLVLEEHAYARGFRDAEEQQMPPIQPQPEHLDFDALALKTEMEDCRTELQRARLEAALVGESFYEVKMARQRVDVRLDAFRMGMDDWMDLRRGEVRRMGEELGLKVYIRTGEEAREESEELMRRARQGERKSGWAGLLGKKTKEKGKIM